MTTHLWPLMTALSEEPIGYLTTRDVKESVMPPTTTVPPEPTFTLRAGFAGSADCLALHAKTAEDLGSPKEYVASVRQAVQEFRDWSGTQTAPGVEPPEA